MNERLHSVQFETETLSDSDHLNRALGKNALETVITSKERSESSQESIRRPDGKVYAQDQEAYKPYAETARAIILQALYGNLDALKQFHRADISGALTARITSRLNEYGDVSNIPADEIDGMISVACGALAEQSNVQAA